MQNDVGFWSLIRAVKRQANLDAMIILVQLTSV